VPRREAGGVDLLGEQPRQQPGHLGDRDHVLGAADLPGVQRHAGGRGLVRVLHQADPAVAADGDHARGAVVQRPGEDDGDDARAGRAGG